MWGFAKALGSEKAKRLALMSTNLTPPPDADPDAWRQRLANLVSYPQLDDVQRFQKKVVLPAMREFAAELGLHGLEARVADESDGTGTVQLEVMHGNEPDFVYAVVTQAHPMPDQAAESKSLEELGELEKYLRAEVHLSEGGQDYCIMGWTHEQVRDDILEQYGKHLYFLHGLR